MRLTGCPVCCERREHKYTWCKTCPLGRCPLFLFCFVLFCSHSTVISYLKKTASITRKYSLLHGMHVHSKRRPTLGIPVITLQPFLSKTTLLCRLTLEALPNIWTWVWFPFFCLIVLPFIMCIWNLPWSSTDLGLQNLPALLLAFLLSSGY